MKGSASSASTSNSARERNFTPRSAPKRSTSCRSRSCFRPICRAKRRKSAGPQQQPSSPKNDAKPKKFRPRAAATHSSSTKKIGQLDYKLAKCCNPIHGDEIFGFITVGAGITIHRTDCPNAQRLRRNYPYRVLEARWRDEAQGAFRVSIRVVASDTTGMINHIAEVINRDLKLSIRSMNLSPGGGLLSGVIHVEVPGTGMVDMLIHSILRIKGVQKAYRVNN